MTVCHPCDTSIPPGEEVERAGYPLCPRCAAVRVRHGGQRHPADLTRGRGTPVEYVQIGKYAGANVLMDPEPGTGHPHHPSTGESYSYVGFYAREHLVVVQGQPPDGMLDG